MLIIVASLKGGVGKTTTSIHFAHGLKELYPSKKVVLVDGDRNRTATGWGKRGADGGNVPAFAIVDENAYDPEQADFSVIDTQGSAPLKDIQELAELADLIVIPTTPDAFSVDALVETVSNLGEYLGKTRVLITATPPPPSRDGEQALTALKDADLTVCSKKIRRYSCYAKSADQGVVVGQLKGQTKAKIAMRDYMEALKEVIDYGA